MYFEIEALSNSVFLKHRKICLLVELQRILKILKSNSSYFDNRKVVFFFVFFKNSCFINNMYWHARRDFFTRTLW